VRRAYEILPHWMQCSRHPAAPADCDVVRITHGLLSGQFRLALDLLSDVG